MRSFRTEDSIAVEFFRMWQFDDNRPAMAVIFGPQDKPADGEDTKQTTYQTPTGYRARHVNSPQLVVWQN
jgi:hypothetical protein